jgi:HPt (histidine-containing phosphotransfer) domain-containing protein
LTANAMLEQVEMFRERGFDDFIAKPIDLRQMNAVLNKFVRDVQPPEVIAAARLQQNGAREHAAAPPPASADPQMTAIFLRDASKSLAVLAAFCERQDDAYTDEDIRTFVVNVHGIKSVLANIGELELSALAARLEQAGRDRDSAFMSSHTPVLLNSLREWIGKITPQEDAKDNEPNEATEEDREYLRENMLAFKAACTAYDKKAAKDVLVELGQRTWSRPIKERLDTIAEYLLHSKFKQITSAADEILSDNFVTQGDTRRVICVP